MEPTVLFLGGLAVTGVISLVSAVRTRRAFRAQRDRSLGEAEAEVRAQVAALADGILELTDRVAIADDPEARRRFAEATAAYTRAQDELERATSLPQLEAASDRLDDGRWELEAARALVDGRALPAESERSATCFFDPTHGAGTAVAAVDSAAGRREVRVCDYCAAKLRAGDTPRPRMIAVGGREVPAAQAPRSHGGGGLDWLGEFTVVLGDARVPYGWGRDRGRRR